MPPDYRASNRGFLSLSGESQLKRVMHIFLATTRDNVEQTFRPKFYGSRYTPTLMTSSQYH